MKKLKFENLIAVVALLGVIILFGSFVFAQSNTQLVVGAVITFTTAALGSAALFKYFQSRVQSKRHNMVSILLMLVCVCLGTVYLNSYAASSSIAINNGSVFDNSGMTITATADLTGDSDTPGSASIDASTVQNGVYSLTIKGQAGKIAGSCDSYSAGTTTITVTIKNATDAIKVLELSVSSDTGGFSSVLINGSAPQTSYDLEPDASITIECEASEMDVSCELVIQNLRMIDKVDEINVNLNKVFLYGESTATVSGAGTYQAGSTISIQADDSADPDYVFLHWIDGYGNIVSTSKDYQIVNPKSDCSYTAVFGYPTVYITIPELCTSYSNVQYTLNGETFTLAGQTFAEPLVIPKSSSLVFSISNEDGFVDWRVLIGSTEHTISGMEYICPLSEPEYIITPYFGSPIAKIGSTQYATLEGALRNAISGNQVVLLQNYCLVSDVTVGANVTLLIPFDESETLITTNMGDNINSEDSAPAKTLYRKLVLASGANVTVNGSICVGSRAYKQMVGQVGPYGAIYMEESSSIRVKSGGTLYAWGYIFGGANGNGSITVDKGGTVYENLMVMDYPGSASSTNDIYKAGYFPLRAYTIRNVEVPMTLHSGAKEYAFYCLWGNSVGTHYGHVLFLGDSSDAVFQLADGATIEKSYQAGKTQMLFDGSFSINSMSVSIKVTLVTVNVNSAETSGVPLPSGYHIEIANGTMTLGDNIILTEGTRVTVHESASVNTNGKNVYVLGNEEAGAVSATDVHGVQYTNVNSNSVMDINGTVTVSGGFYTYGSASIISSKGTGTIIVQQGLSNKDIKIKTSKTTQTTYTGVPANLTNSDSSKVSITVATTYTYVDGFWRCASHSYDSGVNTSEPNCYQDGVKKYTCTVCAHFYTESIAATGAHVDSDTDGHCDTEGCTYEFEYCAHENTTVLPGTDATCTTSGLTEGLQCNDCGLVLTAQTEIPALGHSYNSEITTQPTCEGEGVETHTCEACGDSYTTAIAANGHSYGEPEIITPPSCTEFGEQQETCSTCGNVQASLIDKIDHSYDSVVTDPTCTDAGYTTHTCSACGDSYQDSATTALGHTDTPMYDKEYRWYDCDRCDHDHYDEEARSYSVTVVKFDGTTETHSGVAFDSELGLAVSHSNYYVLNCLGWKVSESGNVLAAGDVWDSFSIDYDTEALTVYEVTELTGLMPEAIMASIQYNAEGDLILTLQMFVEGIVSANDETGKPYHLTVSFAGQSLELVSVPGVNVYTCDIEIPAAELDKDRTVEITYTEVGAEAVITRRIGDVLLTYVEALENTSVSDQLSEQEALATAMLQYANAVYEYFYQDNVFVGTTTFPIENVTDYKTDKAPVIVATDDTNQTAFAAATANFGRTSSLYIYYNLGNIEIPVGATNVKHGVIEFASAPDEAQLDGAYSEEMGGVFYPMYKTHATYGYYAVTDKKGVDNLGDMYYTIYLEYELDGEVYAVYGATMQYGLARYINSQIVKYSPESAQGNGKLIGDSEEKTMAYVNLAYRMLEVYKAAQAVAQAAEG